MNFFRVSESETTGDIVNEFGGLNLSEKKATGDLAHAFNVSHEIFPFLKNASPDIKIKERDGEYCGLIMSDKLFECVKKGAVTKAYFGGVDTGLALSVGKKRLCRMGTKIIIFPDKVYYDTQSGESASLEASFESVEGVGVASHLCDIDGGLLTADFSPTSPETPAVGSYWCDTSSKPYTVKMRTEDAWIELSSVYMKIICPNIGMQFKAGDGVSVTVGEGDAEYYVLEGVGDDYIIIPAVFTPSNSMGKIAVSRLLPETDFEIECKNRIWACRWGLNRNGEFVNEIYASKLGDPTNFNCFEGLSSDSYTVSLGSEGKFTGAAVYLGNIIFFKEKSLHKIYGSKPSEFSLVTVDAPGVADGCERSLVTSDDMLYFVSREGFSAYDGAFPTVISKKLGNPSITCSSAAAVGRYIYLSGLFDGVSRSFFLDAKMNLWCERDYIPLDFASSAGDALFVGDGENLYVLRAKKDRLSELSSLCAGSAENASPLKWCFETGNLSGPVGEYIYKVALRVKVARGAKVAVSAQYRSEGEFESVGVLMPSVERSYCIPILTHKTDSFRLRFEGEGDFVLYSIAKYSNRGIPSYNFRF